MELSCKRCGSSSFVKHGFVRGLQRYRCKNCGLNFTATPKRGRSEATKATMASVNRIRRRSSGIFQQLMKAENIRCQRSLVTSLLQVPSVWLRAPPACDGCCATAVLRTDRPPS